APNYKIETMVPKSVSPGAMVPFVIPMQDGKREIRANIPIAPTDFTIDFFPEGGELVGGVQNRVFYRVRSKSGLPVTGDGRVMLLAGKDGIPEADSTYDLGMGYVDFTPDAQKPYTVRIITPQKIENLPVAFDKIGLRGEGVAMQVAEKDSEF